MKNFLKYTGLLMLIFLALGVFLYGSYMLQYSYDKSNYITHAKCYKHGDKVLDKTFQELVTYKTIGVDHTKIDDIVLWGVDCEVRFIKK